MEKVCVNHPESPSVGSCKACEKPVCLMCITEVQDVSFCSDACGSAYQEVKEWLERPAADEEWNPLAEAKLKPPAAAPKAPAPRDPAPAPVPAYEDPGPSPVAPRRRETAVAVAPPPASGPSRIPLYLALAATVLIVIGAVAAFSGKSETPAPTIPESTPIAKVEPAKPVPVKVEPPKPDPVKVEPPKPVVKVDPPKPAPVKVEPPKPDPVKVEPPKPVVKAEPPKPDPIKVEPPKPDPVKVEIPKPVVKVEPPKPDPVKLEPPKPDPVKVEPPKPVVKVEPPKPDPVKVESPKPPPPPPPPVKVEPPAAPHLAYLRDPWAKEKTGAWYRIKTTANGKDSFTDLGLRETGAGYRVLVSQTSADGKTQPEQFKWTEPEEVSVFGSVNGDAKGTKYAADVVRTKSSKPSQFVFKDGPHAGAAFPSDSTLTALDLQTIRVKDRDFACTVLETDLKDGAHAKTWQSLQLPIGAVKTESAGTTSALVDFGDDWDKRPPFPATAAPVIVKVDPPKPNPVKVEPPTPDPLKVEPPKPDPVKVETPKPPAPPPKPDPVKVEPPKPAPPPPKPDPVKAEPPKPAPPPPPVKVDPAKEEATGRAKKSMADAAALIKEATPMYAEVTSAMETLPTDKPSLRDLYRKAERVQLKLSDARILYSSIRNDAPEPAVIDRRVKQLDDALDGVQESLKTLKVHLE